MADPDCGTGRGGPNARRTHRGRDFNSALGRESGKRSGQARKRLLLSDVEAELGPLLSVEDAQRRLERLGVWAASGLLSGSQAGAAVRSCEVWLRSHAEQLDRDRLRAAEKRVQALERELAAVRGRGLGIA
jgi:hypothetical protein